MQVLAQITLNFQQPNFVTVYAAQNDRLSRFINAALLDGATPWTPPTGALMTIRYRKPDGTSGWYDTLEDGSLAYTVEEDGSITFGLAEQALTVPGMVPVELNFYNAAGAKLSTLTFIVAVKPSAYSDEDIASSDYYNILTAKMQQLAELADSAEGDYQEYLSALSGFVGAPRTAAVAADMLDTGMIYVYTGSETGWTYGDWYYYNGREWTSGGVYNSAAISLDDTLTNANKPAQAKAAGDLVLVQDTQPAATVNKLWFPLTDPEDEQVPTWDEFSELNSDITRDDPILRGWDTNLESGRFINGSGNWGLSAAAKYAAIPISAGDRITLKAGYGVSIYACLKEDYSGASAVAFADGVTGRTTLTAGTGADIIAPANSNYLYVLAETAANHPFEHWPVTLVINGIEYGGSLRDALTEYDTLKNATFSADGLPPVQIGSFISGGGAWINGTNYGVMFWPISAGDKIGVEAGDGTAYIAFLNRQRSGAETAVVYANGESGRRSITANSRAEFTAPAGSKWLYIAHHAGTTIYTPREVTVNGVPVIGGLARKQFCAMRYESGSFDSGKATEKIVVGIPNKDHFVGYTLLHNVDADINCNVWRVGGFSTFDTALNELTALSTRGEMECAVSLQGRADFSGGVLHGDEVMTGMEIFADGKRITANLSAYTGVTPFRELRIVRQSNLYDPNDSTTVIAEHGCEYVFTADGLKINQSLKWAGAYALDNCFMAMFPPSKSVTDHLYTDIDFTPQALTTSNYAITVDGAKKAVIYGNTSGFEAEFTIERYPTGLTGGDRLLATDNGGNGYNKLYYYAADGGNTAADELWQSTTVYKIKA